MDDNKVIEILQNEMACVIRADQKRCDRRCENCDLVRPTEEIVEAYSTAINTVELAKEIKKIVSVC